jgi:hypothetical protein
VPPPKGYDWITNEYWNDGMMEYRVVNRDRPDHAGCDDELPQKGGHPKGARFEAVNLKDAFRIVVPANVIFGDDR